MMIKLLTRSKVPAIISRSQRNASSFVTQLHDSIHSLPLKEAARYKHKNLKLTADEFKVQADAHAEALLEYGVQGSVALWMRESAEKHVSLLALAKMGVKIADIDINIDSVADVRKFLKISDCQTIIFDPSTETSDHLLLLRKAIPEFYAYDDTYGQIFHSKHFPSLRYFIHTGYDSEVGCLTYKGAFLFKNLMEKVVSEVELGHTDSTPAYFSIKKGESDLEVSKVATHGELMTHPSYWFAKNIIEKKYFEC